MERDTQVVETPISKQKVKIYTYLTGREFEYCQEPLFEAVAPQAKGAMGAPTVEFGSINIIKLREATQRLIEKHVVDIDGNKEDIGNKILDMHNTDYQFIVTTLQNLSKKN